jgi:branched-subunit amino acid aminotransferase/4-amino-4-deoxychorismate lyase
VSIFRPQANIARMNRSAKRMCMPHIPEDLFLDALTQLVQLDKDWLPEGDEASLYIRPFLFASDEYIGVKPSDNYKFIIFTCPVRSYYNEPVRVKIETNTAARSREAPARPSAAATTPVVCIQRRWARTRATTSSSGPMD